MVVVLVFLLLVITLYFASRRVRTSIDQIVASSLQQTAENSQNSRDFGLLNARLSVFKNTFYIDDSWYEVESTGLQQDIQDLQAAVSDPGLAVFLVQLHEQVSVYLEHREWINYLLFWRSGEDENIGELFSLLQEIIVEKISEVTLAGGDADYLKSLALLISHCQVDLSRIAKLNAEENPASLLSVPMDTPIPLQTELSDLVLQLRPLTASEPPINRLGRHLIDHFSYYQYQMQQYQSEMIGLGELSRGLDQSTVKIISAMDQLDQNTAATMVDSKLKISKTIITMVISVQFVLLLLATLFWFVFRNIFKKHIQDPMNMVSERLEMFWQGDQSSPMQLGRNDEWGEIEEVFNKMLLNLQEGVFALQESEKRYREIFDNASEGIFQVKISGEIIAVNRAGTEIFGYDSPLDPAIFSISLQDDIYSQREDRDQWFRLLQLQGNVRDFEAQMVRKDGSLFWASINGHLVQGVDGQIAYIEGTIQDISVRRSAQESVQQLQIYLQNIIDSMPSVLIGVDINMQVTLWNKRAEQESVLTAEEAKGLSMTDVCRLFDSTAYIPKLLETLRTQKQTRLLRIESNKKMEDGRSRFFDILIYPLSTTEKSGAVIHMDDVTERLQLEEMMVRSEKMQSIGGLAAGLAHEINNPLAAILQSVQVLSHRLSPDLNKNRKTAQELGTTIETIAEYTRLRGCEKMIHSISDAGQRAAKIVENVQSFSHHGVSNFISCAITDLLERTVELAGSDHDMRHHFDFRKISIVREYRSVPNVCCEASQIQQVILILLKNAAQALTKNTAVPQITLRLFPFGENHACLQIEDNGPGMEPDVVERIFDPFYTTQVVGKGVGLGLSIAYFMAVHNHNGRLSVTSTPGSGSCFEMVLPLTNVAMAGEDL